MNPLPPLLACVLALDALAAAPGGQVIVVDNPSLHYGAIAVHPSVRKFYVGRGHDARTTESGCWVYDIFQDGAITATDERAFPLPPPGHAGNLVYVTDMAVSPQGRTLYLGLAGSPNSEKRCVAIQDLDEKGEPSGAMRTCDPKVGFETPHLLPHPKLDSLYAWFSRRDTFYSIPLVKGEPSGGSKPCPVKGGSTVALLLSADGGNLFAVSSSGLLTVFRLDAGGMTEPEPASHLIADAGDVTSAARVGRVIFLVSKGRLLSQLINGDGDPVGQPVVAVASGVLEVCAPADGVLCLVLGDGKGGSRIARHKPDASGQIGPAIFTSDVLNGKITRLTLDTTTGIFYIVLNP